MPAAIANGGSIKSFNIEEFSTLKVS